MEPQAPKRKLVIVTGTAQIVEDELNALLGEYTATAWNFCALGDQVRITVVLVADSEIRKQQLAAIQQIPAMRRG